MRLLLACMVLLVAPAVPALAEKGTYVDSVQFIQYLDENTALEQVRNGNLDMYYYRISSDRLESPKDREGIQVFDSTGGSYSLLVNPAASKEFNPFSIKEVRYALNYLVDRKLIVNELMGGFGTVMISNYGPYDPDYLAILEQTESFNFKYNPSLAGEIIGGSLRDAGAGQSDGQWRMDGAPIEISVFIRSDDPIRKSIGELLASELESLGFAVKRDYGDLNKAFVIVYGSDPSELKWSVYTEGWAGRSAFVRYDSLGLSQMYSPWFSNMPGFNDPSYWNYENDRLDSLTQKIYTGNFSTPQERAGLIQDATIEGIGESVRIFLAGTINRYVANDGVDGVINDFGAGVPGRFTPINSRSDSDSLAIGVKHIYQGAWNPVVGMSDVYSRYIWDALFDPGVFKHPYTGKSFPVRTDWHTETAGPDGKIMVPSDAIIWNVQEQRWLKVPAGTQATSKVTFDLLLGDWHHGRPMEMSDVLYSLYFTLEWGSEQQKGDRTFDAEYTPRAAQLVNTLVGIRPIDADTIEVYTDYWHFDESEIAHWASVWSSTPWEIQAAMEQAVIDGKAAFSRSSATSKGINWLSLIVPRDAAIIREGIAQLRDSGSVPRPLEGFVAGDGHIQRYQASLEWIDANNHAVISNGPFYLDRYSPESRTIQINAFADDSYPFGAGYWGEFEHVRFPRITGVSVPDLVRIGQTVSIPVSTEYASRLHYFFTNTTGSHVSSGIIEIESDSALLVLTGAQSRLLGGGANDLKLFAVSDDVLRPDGYATSFFATDAITELPAVRTDPQKEQPETQYAPAIVAVLAAVAIVFALLRFRRSST